MSKIKVSKFNFSVILHKSLFHVITNDFKDKDDITPPHTDVFVEGGYNKGLHPPFALSIN